MRTDLDRLHNVVNGSTNYRGCGKTFARCHEVAGLIELKHKTIICKTSLNRAFLYIKPMIVQVLEEHCIKINNITTQPFEIHTDVGARITFIPENIYDFKIRYYSELAIVDMRQGL